MSATTAARHRPARRPAPHLPPSPARGLGALVSWPLVGVAVVSAAWALLLRDDARTATAARGVAAPSAPEALVTYLGDPYLIVFFIVPTYLALTTTSITSTAAYPVLARVSTTARWLAWSAHTAIAPTAAIATVWLIAGGLGALGLSWVAGPISDAGIARSQVLQALATQSGGAGTPAWAYVPAQVLLLVVGLLALRTVVALVYLLTRSPGAAPLTAAALWIATIVSFKAPFEGNVGPVDALVLHQGGQYLPWWATAAMPAAAIAAVVATGPVIDRAAALRRATDDSSPVTRAAAWARRPGVVYAAVMAAVVLAVIPQVAATATTPWEVFLSLAWGTSPYGVAPVTFAAFTVVIAGFAYLIALQLHEQLGDRLPYVMIRHRSMSAWTLHLLGRCAAQGAALLAGIFTLTAVAGHLLVDVSTTGTAPAEADPGVITMSGAALHQFALNGVLQLAAYSAALFLITWWTRSPIWSLGAIAAIAALHLPGANAEGWIPVGLNSVGMLTTANPTRMSLELLAINTVLITAALVSVRSSATTERS